MNEDYFQQYNTYTAKYGKKTAVWYQVGSFFELFDEINTQTGQSKANVRELAELLGLQISTKKDIAPNTDEIFAGIPDHTIDRWAGKLTSLGWTSVLIEQQKDARGKIVKRAVSRILSPSTHIENISSTEVPYLLVITLSSSSKTSTPPHYGVAVLDLSTGTTHTYSNTATGRYDAWVADELVQMMSVYQAKEIVVIVTPGISMDETAFRRQFGIAPITPVHFRSMDQGAFSIPLVRNEYLQRVFAIKSLLPPRTFLGLRTEDEEYALLQLLQFTEDHYPSMVRSFQRNHPWQPQSRLICGNHALTQLQLTGPNPSETVISLFDKAITPMGKRKMQERLLSPYSTAADIQARLHEVTHYMSWSDENTAAVERNLRFMYDLPRLHRRVLCGLVTFTEIANLFQTYRAMEHIMTEQTPNTPLTTPYSIEEWNTYLSAFRTHFDETKALTASSDQTAFTSETYPVIAEKEGEIQTTIQTVHDLRKELALIGKVPEDAIRLEEREKEPFGFKASSVVLQQLKKQSAVMPTGTKFNELKSGGWIDCLRLQQLNGKVARLREQLQQLIHQHLLEACSNIAVAGRELWQPMEEWISLVDVTQCIARVSRERSYVCPTVAPADDQSDTESFVEIKQMRHPLVEQTASRVAYVKHDVSLGRDADRGWLLYALNGVGKTVLMKATGLCVLLAQAGCFVPAKSMVFRPFTAIYTRILNNDNLFQGLSTFTVEMSELREILTHANRTTLVLGDELSSGTESISGQALVTASLRWLADRGSKFIFATHLHDVPKRLNLKEDRIAVWHLHVEYDPITKKLIYDRSLRPGNGSTLYGLEVARALDLPSAFIEEALAIRHQIIGSVKQQDSSPSAAWNTQIVRKECEVCHSPIVAGLEVHHLEQRASASEHGTLPDGSHMNDARNLLVICQECHDRLHAGHIRVGQLQMTTEGPERMIIHTEEQKHPGAPVSPLAATSSFKKQSKWTEEEMEHVRDTLCKYPSSSLKSIRAFLSSTHSIEMSESVLSRLRKEL